MGAPSINSESMSLNTAKIFQQQPFDVRRVSSIESVSQNF